MEGPRVVVTSGHPTERELAAIVAMIAARPSPTADATDTPAPGWVRAARLEGCGHPPIDSPMRLAPTGCRSTHG